jgi:hypothetical protein
MEETDGQKRDILLQHYSFKIWKRENCGQCTKRMRCILNAEAMGRIWPDNSWMIKDEEDIGKIINMIFN